MRQRKREGLRTRASNGQSKASLAGLARGASLNRAVERRAKRVDGKIAVLWACCNWQRGTQDCKAQRVMPASDLYQTREPGQQRVALDVQSETAIEGEAQIDG